ncbi:MAG TPA: hypothetical protein ENG47_07240 [Candidatus Aerophobetes bacterium]|uniref:Uncharacterized protein n=1 Tax=Aerophobetes bacterium TaxID=2030807 RepID=A0A662DLH1_UNCAE|nr:MAG: hypothetical protein DRI96_00400 [Candidatus Aerophobetes bacterium]HDN85529.1 hypothetical protein [Candidatus Aerophobetes bacterium]
MEKVSFEVKVTPVKGIPVSKEVLQRLKEVTKKLVKINLLTDYEKSWKIIVETKILSKIENGYQCESLITFLYRETYTAVLVKMEFYYIPEKIENIKIQRNYIPKTKTENKT